MNYGLELSLKLEKHLAVLEAEGIEDDSENGSLEDRAMKMAQEEMVEESEGRWKPWCANAKSLRMGQIVLIIDADTIIPEVSCNTKISHFSIRRLRAVSLHDAVGCRRMHMRR